MDFEEGRKLIESILIAYLEPEINDKKTVTLSYTDDLKINNISSPHPSFKKTMSASAAHMLITQRTKDKKEEKKAKDAKKREPDMLNNWL